MTVAVQPWTREAKQAELRPNTPKSHVIVVLLSGSTFFKSRNYTARQYVKINTEVLSLEHAAPCHRINTTRRTLHILPQMVTDTQVKERNPHAGYMEVKKLMTAFF